MGLEKNSDVDADGVLRAAAGQRESRGPGQGIPEGVAVDDEPDRVRRAAQLRLAELLRAGDARPEQGRRRASRQAEGRARGVGDRGRTARQRRRRHAGVHAGRVQGHRRHRPGRPHAAHGRPSKDTRAWQFTGGKWNVQGQAIKPTRRTPSLGRITGDVKWTRLHRSDSKPRKVGGREGFVVLWHAADGDNYHWWNIGGAAEYRRPVRGRATSGASENFGPSTPFHGRDGAVVRPAAGGQRAARVRGLHRRQARDRGGQPPARGGHAGVCVGDVRRG